MITFFSFGNFGFENCEWFVGVLFGGSVIHVPNLDTLFGTGSNPLESGVESDGVNGASSIELSVGGGEVADIPNNQSIIKLI